MNVVITEYFGSMSNDVNDHSLLTQIACMHPEVFERAYEKVSAHFENQDSKCENVVFPLDVETMDGHSILIFESELNSLRSSFQNAVRRGKSGKISAIKTLRGWENVSLKNSKEFIEYLQNVGMLPIE